MLDQSTVSNGTNGLQNTEKMGDEKWGSFVCKYYHGTNELCMIASITNVTSMAIDTYRSASLNSHQKSSFLQNQKKTKLVSRFTVSCLFSPFLGRKDV